MTTKNYFTFGVNHTHSHEGITLDKDGVVLIHGEPGAARDHMFDLFGPKWSMHYTENTYNPMYFPRGVVLEIDLRQEQT